MLRSNYLQLRIVIVFLFLLSSKPVSAQWLNEPGKLWVDISTFHQNTRSQFWFDGSEIQLFEEGHIITTATFLTSAIGIIDGLDAWIQVPVLRSRFSDIVGDRLSQGLSDPRFYLRASPKLFHIDLPVPIAIRLGIKAPVGSFEKDAEILALGDGQLDLEAILELGYSSKNGQNYILGWLGYRWRFENKESLFSPGNEILSLIKFGTRSQQFTFETSIEWLSGSTPISQGLLIPNSTREMLQVSPSVGYDFGVAHTKFGLALPMRGRNLPSGKSITASLFIPFTL